MCKRDNKPAIYNMCKRDDKPAIYICARETINRLYMCKRDNKIRLIIYFNKEGSIESITLTSATFCLV